MARTVNMAAHARRRDEFLDAAQRLIETRGYDDMSIQDVLDETGTSRGAFYHYFGSKSQLMSAVVERFSDTMASLLEPVVKDPDLSALDKVGSVLTLLAVRKGQQHEALVLMLRVWYSDANTRVRQKARAGIIDRLTRVFQIIVADGIHDGTLDISDAEMSSRVLATLIQDLHDELADHFLMQEDRAANMTTVERTVAAYTRAIERILGVPEGSVVLDVAPLRAWIGPL